MVSPDPNIGPVGLTIHTYAVKQEREQRQRRATHARLGVMAFVLILAVVCLQQAFAGGGDRSPALRQPALPAAAASPSTAPIEPPPTVTPTAATQTHAVRQVASAQSPTSLIPTVTPTLEPIVAATEPTVPTEATEELTVVEPIVEPTSAPDEETDEGFVSEPETAQGSLAVPILADAWEAAIHTWDGGVMGIVTSSELNVRAAPAVDGEIVDTTWIWHPVVVYDVVHGDWVGETDVWYAIGVGQFVSAAFVEPFIPALPVSSYAGAWVDVNVSTGYAVAYQGDVPVYAALVSYGKPGFETPLGDHTIFARVESDTLDSTTTGIPKGDAESYYLTDVPHVQYFAEGGFALHANYWDETWEFGGPTSHGCINLTPADAAFFWNFLDIGSVVSVHE